MNGCKLIYVNIKNFNEKKWKEIIRIGFGGLTTLKLIVVFLLHDTDLSSYFDCNAIIYGIHYFLLLRIKNIFKSET